MNLKSRNKTNVSRGLMLSGIFGIFLLLGFMSALIFSPVIRTNASDIVMDSRLDAKINEVASLAVDKDSLELIVPSPTDEGVFVENSITVTASTNSTSGYELYFSSIDDDTDMTYETSNVSDVIASDFSGTVTSSTMAKNKWGYSLDDTNFSKIPTLSAQAKLRDIDHMPSASEKTTTVQIGAKISSDLPSGRYKKNVVLSLVSHPAPLPTIADISTMQQMTSAICSATAAGTTATLTDTRDNNTYTVFKGADGKCWMSQNLRLINKTITSLDSNIPAGTTFTVPGNNWAGSVSGTDKFIHPYVLRYTGSTGYDIFYNYPAATAGTVASTSTSANAAYDICPKNWRLPAMTDFRDLFNAYSIENNAAGSAALQEAPLNFDNPGLLVYNSTTPEGRGGSGSWWSATASSTTNSSVVRKAASTAAYNYNIDRRYGVAIRCVAEQRTINDITYMQDITPTIVANTAEGTTKTLTDRRDNNTYTVFKGKDGNVWMSQNLRLINKTITSDDSNIASGTSFTVPNNNWGSGLNETNKYNNAYTYQTGNTDYGVYYNYAAATAGTISGTSNSTDATYDICPKGWKLPSHNQQATLLSAYNVTNNATGSAILRSAPLNFVYSGYIDYISTSSGGQGQYGGWWSSTAVNTTNRYRIYLASSNANATDRQRSYGISVRCITR